MDVRRKKLKKYLLKRVRRSINPGGCWEWMGSTAGNGYGVFTYRGKRYNVRRLCYELFREPIPSKKRLENSCGTYGCINPKHSYVGERKKGGRPKSS